MNLAAARRRSAHGLAAIVAFATLALHDPSLAAERGSAEMTLFTSADVFQLKSVSDVQISPDGRSVAYLAGDIDIMIDGRRSTIRIDDTATKIERVLATDGTSPRWSPDGRSIAYVGRSPTGGSRLVVADPESDAHRTVADLPDAPSAPVWSPNGGQLAFTMFVATPAPVRPAPVAKPSGAKWAEPPRIISGVRYQRDGAGFLEPGRDRLFVVAETGGVPKQLTVGTTDVEGDPAWTSDGTGLVIGLQHRGDHEVGDEAVRLHRVSSTSGAETALTPADLVARSPAISPDGRQVAFTAFANDGRDYSAGGLYVMDVGGGGVRRLDQKLDREVFEPHWSSDGRSLYFAYGDHGIDKIGRVGLDGRIEEVAIGAIDGYSVSRTSVLAYAAGRSDRPADVTVQPPRGSPRQLTDRNDPLLSTKSLGTVEELAVRSSLDGVAVGAWLTLPPGRRAGRRLPMILSIHGGPYGYDSPVWSTTDQMYAAAGYAVLHANYRGSVSYGSAFAYRIAGDFPAPAYTDLMSAVDAAVAKGIADPARLFVTGGSAGGQLTAWTVGSTKRFKAAMAEKPVINELSQGLTSDQYATAKMAAFGAQPWDAQERYWAGSPLSLVGRVETPTLIVVGEQDRRTPVSESLQFYNALSIRGIPTGLVIMPGASHSSLGRRPSQLVTEIDLTLNWFARHGGTADPANQGVAENGAPARP